MVTGHGSSWRRTATGLYLPAAASPPARQPEAPAGTAAPGSEEFDHRMLDATRMQAIGTVIAAAAGVAALVITIGALVISAAAWHGQRELNRQQAQLNAYAQESDREVYSSRVAMWATIGDQTSSVLPAGLDVRVENRAPVPMHNARILAGLASHADAELDLGDLPPCTLLALRIAPPAGETFERNSQEWLGYTELRLTFVETGRFWLLTKDSLTQLPAAPGRDGVRQLRQAASSQKTMDGCGTGP